MEPQKVILKRDLRTFRHQVYFALMWVFIVSFMLWVYISLKDAEFMVYVFLIEFLLLIPYFILCLIYVRVTNSKKFIEIGESGINDKLSLFEKYIPFYEINSMDIDLYKKTMTITNSNGKKSVYAPLILNEILIDEVMSSFKSYKEK